MTVVSHPTFHCESLSDLPIMRPHVVILIALFAVSLKVTHGENVLFFIGGVSSHSHRYGLEPVAIRLAERGHNVTFFSPLRPSKPNSKITNYCVPEVTVAHQGFVDKFGVFGLQERVKQKYNMDMGNDPDEIFDIVLDISKITLTSPEFQDWVHKSKFDLVIIDKSTLSDLAYAIAHKHNAKVITYSGIASVLPWDLDNYGLPSEASWIPQFDLYFEGKEMGFIARVKNELSAFQWRWSYGKYIEKQNKQVKELLNIPEMPPLKELITEESIVLTNMHYSCGYAKALPPFMIAAGGMHLEESNGTLPKDIEEFVGGAGDEGFMYISFGSIVTISTMPEWLLNVFFEALGASKMRFLWKWEGEKPKNVPKNVFLLKWFPQNDVLAHPKIRGFVTQGGQVSMQQAIFHGVPVMIFPVNGDQDYNAKRVRRYENGIEMEFHGLTAQELTHSIKELTENPRYKETARRLSVASKERPLSALDEAMWWVDFVLRHDKEQLKLLKPLSVGQPWYIVQSLDVWAFIVLCIIVAVSTTVLVPVIIVKKFVKSSTKMPEKSLKKKKTN